MNYKKELLDLYKIVNKPRKGGVVWAMIFFLLCSLLLTAGVMENNRDKIICFCICTVLALGVFYFVCRRYKRRMEEYKAGYEKYAAELKTIDEEEDAIVEMADRDVRKYYRLLVFLMVLSLLAVILNILGVLF